MLLFLAYFKVCIFLDKVIFCMKKVSIALLGIFICSSAFAKWYDGGYLSQEQITDTTSLIGAPPSSDSIAFLNDKAISEATFSLDKDNPKYQQAINHSDDNLDDVMSEFSEVVGQSIDKENTPYIYSLLEKSTNDANNFKDKAKNHYKRKRPFVYFDRKPCSTTEDGTTYSYPSGHSTRAWNDGLILASLKPQKANEILDMSKSMAESRVICGAHWPSDIKAAQTVAMTEFTILQTNLEYRQDFTNALAEIK